jgi:hypothetical protein
MIINRIYKTQNLVAVSCFLPGRAKDLSAPLYNGTQTRNLSTYCNVNGSIDEDFIYQIQTVAVIQFTSRN